MGEIRIYKPPTVGSPVFENRGIVTAATSIATVEKHYESGWVDITVPTDARHADRLTEGNIVLIDGAFWGVIDDVNFTDGSDGDLLTVSGRQFKGLTKDRITIPPDCNSISGAQGYDAAAGTTEAVMKHFVQANMINQTARLITGLQIAPDQGRGFADDKYMSRHEVLSDVLQALGEAAELGYDIVPDLSAHKLVFDVVEGADHTALQSDRKRVVFEIERKTANAQNYAHHTSDSRNLFYATLSGAEYADEALTLSYIRDGEAESVGIYRKEQHLSISADTPVAGEEYNELRRKALIEAEGYRPAESFTCEIADGLYVYRRDYNVGDKVSVRNRKWGVTMHTRLTAMQTNYSGSGITRTATFGIPPLNVFGRLRRQITRGG